MSLKIEIVEGPGAGRIYEFDDSVGLIEIGRDPEHCNVSFPPDFTTVGRRHLAIRNNAGHYDLETNLTNPVLIDGREPFDGESLGPVHRLQLGVKGPVLEVRTVLNGALPPTDPTPIARSASQKYRLYARTQAWLAAGLVAVIVAGAAAFGYSAWRSHNERVLLAEISQKIRATSSLEVMSTDILREAAHSVYLILIARSDGAETPVGTAWVYKPGLLATNSHVAETFNELSPGQRLIARTTMPPYSSIDIVSVKLHPDYARFTETWQKRSPVRGDVGDQPMQMNAPGAGYDVALMQVANQGLLQPPLEIAGADSLTGLQPGVVVGYAGFPMEGLAAGGINPKAPVPQVQIGHITAVTDYFLLPGNPAERLLVQHSIPTTGGASGSPMIDKSGRVVGLISGINIVPSNGGSRAPNAASVNFAQRADLIHEVEKGIDQDLARARVTSWEDGFATFDDPVVLVPRSIRKEWLANNDTATAVELLNQAGFLEPTGKPNDYAVQFRSVITRPGRYLVLSVSPSRKNIDIAITRGGEPIDADTSDDWFPYVTLDLDAGDDLDVLVLASGQEEAPDYKLLIWEIPPATQ